MPRPVARITPLLLPVLLGACASIGDASRLSAPLASVAEARSGPAGTPIRWSCADTLDPASHPLMVVDGRVQDSTALADLKPEDVETIEVLKGVSARAIYGAGAEHGALIITTRRGRPAAQVPRPVAPAS